jgi:hypothetical protein
VDARVTSVDGRVIRTLAHDTRAAGRSWLSWDGRAADGSRAPAGVYFVRVASGGDVATRRVIRLE